MSALNNGSRFSRFAQTAARVMGGPRAFMLALCVVVVWGLSGPLFDFNDTWQLVINTGTTIITFLMVFLIQNTQNRDAEAMQIKLDELIRAAHEAHNPCSIWKSSSRWSWNAFGHVTRTWRSRPGMNCAASPTLVPTTTRRKPSLLRRRHV